MERMALQWTEGLTPITKIWCGAVLGTSVLVSTKVISGDDTVFDPTLVWKGHQYWRIPLSFTYLGSLHINMFLSLFHTVEVFGDLEASLGGPLEFAWFLLATMMMFIGFATYMNTSALFNGYLSSTLLYFWAKRRPDENLLLLMVVPVKASTYCVLVLVIGIVFRKYNELFMATVGHALFFFYEVVPKIHGFNPIAPPWVLIKDLRERGVRDQRLNTAREQHD
jgi:Derlin-2/3